MPNILIIGLDYGPIIFLRCQKGKIYPNIATSTNVIHHIRCTKSSAMLDIFLFYFDAESWVKMYPAFDNLTYVFLLTALWAGLKNIFGLLVLPHSKCCLKHVSDDYLWHSLQRSVLIFNSKIFGYQLFNHFASIGLGGGRPNFYTF